MLQPKAGLQFDTKNCKNKSIIDSFQKSKEIINFDRRLMTVDAVTLLSQNSSFIDLFALVVFALL